MDIHEFCGCRLQSFSETHLSNLLKNFAELDWRITQRDPESSKEEYEARAKKGHCSGMNSREIMVR